MPRKKTVEPVILDEVKDDAKDVVASEDNLTAKNQVVVPYGIARPLDGDIILDLESKVVKTFEVPRKYYIVYDNGEVVDEIPENDNSIQKYLDYNHQQLQDYLEELNAEVSDPNLLIHFNVGKQSRKYLTYDAYFSQNGLAPKPCLLKSWMAYFKHKHPNFSEEELAVNVKGQLRYSFGLVQK